MRDPPAVARARSAGAHGEGSRRVILIFCAFGAELAPLRARLTAEKKLDIKEVTVSYGRMGDTSVALAASGIGMRRARESARRVFDGLRDLDLVIITGVAGALSNGLAIGDLVVVDRLIARSADNTKPDQVVEIAPDRIAAVTTALTAAKIPFTAGPILTVKFPLATEADKRSAGQSSGAIAVDMESAVIALEAIARGVPVVCIRTIMDTVEHDLAGARLADQDGNVRVLAAAAALIRNPRMVGGVIRLVRNLRQATGAMAIAVEAVVTRLA
jgi:adenosylhomocysteine nucleosidase